MFWLNELSHLTIVLVGVRDRIFRLRTGRGGVGLKVKLKVLISPFSPVKKLIQASRAIGLS
ncbi:hypothetical protein D3C75_1274750 [compost metagenome]